MDNIVRSRLEELSSVSASAQRIARRMGLIPAEQQLSATAASGDPVSKEEIADLVTRVAALSNLVEVLREERDHAYDVEVSDEDIADFRTRVRATMKECPSDMLLRNYDRAYFAATPRSLRGVIASELLDIFEDRKRNPMRLWTALVTSDGAL